MTPPAVYTAAPRDEQPIPFADHTRAMKAATRQMSRWSTLLDRLAQE